MSRFFVWSFGVALTLGGVVACASDNGEPTLGVSRSEQIVPPAMGPVPMIGPEARPIPGKKIAVASVASMRELFGRTETNREKRFALPSIDGDIPVVIVGYEAGRGKLEMAGYVAGAEGSSVVLTAGDQGIQGWVVYEDRTAAFAYDSDAAGNVVVETVPIEAVPIEAIWDRTSRFPAADPK